MKGKYLRIISSLVALVMMFSLIACGENSDGETTTTTAENSQTEPTKTEGKEQETQTDKNGEVITTEADDITGKTTNNGKETTTKDGTETTDKNGTTKPSTTKKDTGAPVDGTIAEIVEFYNKAANATKAKQNLKCTQWDVTKITIDSISDIKPNWLNTDFVRNTALDIGNMVCERVSEKGVTYEEHYINGKPTKGDTPKNELFPIMDDSKMSTLTADGVKSATCKKDKDGYIVTIVLKKEVGTNKKKPKAHAACVNYLRLETLDLDPFYISEATMNYDDGTNSGTKFVARINKNNLLDYMNTYMSIKGSGTGGADLLVGSISASAKLHGTYEARYNFIW